jgi:endo-1,4-beta-xylanase
MPPTVASAAVDFGVVTRSLSPFDFTEADRIVAFAVQHGREVRGHTLVWHLCLPDRLSGGGFGPAELCNILKGHIDTMLVRYRFVAISSPAP